MTGDNERILMQLRGVPAKTMTRLEAMMDPANPQTFEANDNDRRVAELDAENRRMREALENVVDAWNCQDPDIMCDISRAALSQEEKP